MTMSMRYYVYVCERKIVSMCMFETDVNVTSGHLILKS